MSCTFRQNNIIWVLYAYATSQVTKQRFRKADGDAKLYDASALTASPGKRVFPEQNELIYVRFYTYSRSTTVYCKRSEGPTPNSAALPAVRSRGCSVCSFRGVEWGHCAWYVSCDPDVQILKLTHCSRRQVESCPSLSYSSVVLLCGLCNVDGLASTSCEQRRGSAPRAGRLA